MNLQEQYLPLIHKYASEHGVDPELVIKLIQAESNWDPKAVSPVGAQGLMQLMPATAADLGVTDAFDPDQNTNAGIKYLSQMLAKFPDQRTALAAYNFGPGNVSRGNPWPKETLSYVDKILGPAAAAAPVPPPPPEAPPAPVVVDPEAPAFPGLLVPGNASLKNLPVVKNKDGTTSSIRSISVNIDGKEVLIPTVSKDGRIMPNDEAIQQYQQTGKHLGIFDTPEHATAFADRIHNDQDALIRGSRGDVRSRVLADPDFQKFDPATQSRILAKLGAKGPFMRANTNPTPEPSSTPEAFERIMEASGISGVLDKLIGKVKTTTGEKLSTTPSTAEKPLNETDAAAALRGTAIATTPMVAPLLAALGLSAPAVAAAKGAGEMMLSAPALLKMLGIGAAGSLAVEPVGRAVGGAYGVPELGSVAGEVLGGAAAAPFIPRTPPSTTEHARQVGQQLLSTLLKRAKLPTRAETPSVPGSSEIDAFISLLRRSMASMPEPDPALAAERMALADRGPIRGKVSSDAPIEPRIDSRFVKTPQEVAAEARAAAIASGAPPQPIVGPGHVVESRPLVTGERVELTGAAPRLEGDEAASRAYLAVEAERLRAQRAAVEEAVEAAATAAPEVKPKSNLELAAEEAAASIPDETLRAAEASAVIENASGESVASVEALSRQAQMAAKGETYVVYDRAGNRRPLIGPDAVDYVAKKGETYGIEGPDGFQTLDNKGGKVPTSQAASTATPAPAVIPPAADAPTARISGASYRAGEVVKDGPYAGQTVVAIEEGGIPVLSKRPKPDAAPAAAEAPPPPTPPPPVAAAAAAPPRPVSPAPAAAARPGLNLEPQPPAAAAAAPPPAAASVPPKPGTRVRLSANEAEGWPAEEGIVLKGAQTKEGAFVEGGLNDTLIVKVDTKYRTGPDDDGYREITIDQIEPLLAPVAAKPKVDVLKALKVKVPKKVEPPAAAAPIAETPPSRFPSRAERQAARAPQPVATTTRPKESDAWEESLLGLDELGVKDVEYRDILPAERRSLLKPGETWRARVLSEIAADRGTTTTAAPAAPLAAPVVRTPDIMRFAWEEKGIVPPEFIAYFKRENKGEEPTADDIKTGMPAWLIRMGSRPRPGEIKSVAPKGTRAVPKGDIQTEAMKPRLGGAGSASPKGPKYSVSGERSSQHEPVFLEDLNENLPEGLRGKAKWDGEQGGYFIDTPRGQILIEPTGDVIVNWTALEEGYSEKGVAAVKAGAGKLIGSTTKIGHDAYVQIVNKGAIPHEVGGHVFLDHFVTDAERAVINKSLGKAAEAQGVTVDEMFAEGYHDWFMNDRAKLENETGIQKIYRRVYEFFEGIYRTFKPDVKSIYKNVARGDAFERSPIADVSEPIPGLARAAMAEAKLTPEQRAANFKTFFEGSKVTTNTAKTKQMTTEGEPLKVYHSGSFEEGLHGTPDTTYGFHFGTKTAAQHRTIGKRSEDILRDLEITKDEETGRYSWYRPEDGLSSSDLDDFTYPTAEAAKANAIKIAKMEDESYFENFDEDDLPLTEAWLSIKKPMWSADPGDEWAPIIRRAKDGGYDGIIYRNKYEDPGELSYIVFKPSQIKSTKNVGTFSKETGDVRYGAAEAPALSREERTANLEKWGPLKGDKGQPLVLYHGTSKDQNFHTFKNKDRGIWLAQDPDVASYYAKDNDSKGHRFNPLPGKPWNIDEINTASRVFKLYAKMDNPKVYEEMPEHVRTAENYTKAQAALFRELRAAGHDGVIMKDPKGEDSVYVVFDRKQLKSALGNKGTFSDRTPDIRYSVEPRVQAARESAAYDFAMKTPTEHKLVSTDKDLKVYEFPYEGGTYRYEWTDEGGIASLWETSAPAVGEREKTADGGPLVGEPESQPGEEDRGRFTGVDLGPRLRREGLSKETPLAVKTELDAGALKTLDSVFEELKRVVLGLSSDPKTQENTKKARLGGLTNQMTNLLGQYDRDSGKVHIRPGSHEDDDPWTTETDEFLDTLLHEIIHADPDAFHGSGEAWFQRRMKQAKADPEVKKVLQFYRDNIPPDYFTKWRDQTWATMNTPDDRGKKLMKILKLRPPG